MKPEVFELSLLGGAVERRYRRMRPDVERLPWGTLDLSGLTPAAIAQGRRFWTIAAFQEHRSGAACAATLQALIAARAPVDLIAVASRFVLDEMTHVELCARVAGELGGGASISHLPSQLLEGADPKLPPLVAVAELVVRVFCVGEAFSVPMQRATARAATHPLIKAVIGRIAKDEIVHGAFGWEFLDWAGEFLDDAARDHLRGVAARAIAALERTLETLSVAGDAAGHSLGWLPRDVYLSTARSALADDVVAPLRARGI